MQQPSLSRAQVVHRLSSVRGNENLSSYQFGDPFELGEPRLHLADREKIVWFIEEEQLPWLDGQREEVQTEDLSLAIRELLEAELLISSFD